MRALLAAFALLAPVVASAAPDRVVVLGVTGEAVSPDALPGVAAAVREGLAEAGPAIEVVPREALVEIYRTRRPCVPGDLPCDLEVGRALSAARLVRGRVDFVESGLAVSLSMIDARTGLRLAVSREVAPDATRLSDAARAAGRALVAQARSAPAASAAPVPAPSAAPPPVEERTHSDPWVQAVHMDGLVYTPGRLVAKDDKIEFVPDAAALHKGGAHIRYDEIVEVTRYPDVTKPGVYVVTRNRGWGFQTYDADRAIRLIHEQMYEWRRRR